MKWHRVTLLVVVGLLVSGLSAGALAHRPPSQGPPRPPVQWGDPDWPSYISVFDEVRTRAVACGEDGSTQISDPATEPAKPGLEEALRRRHVLRSRQCKIEILGRTIIIRR
jgi:hypothetical protein